MIHSFIRVYHTTTDNKGERNMNATVVGDKVKEKVLKLLTKQLKQQKKTCFVEKAYTKSIITRTSQYIQMDEFVFTCLLH